MKEPDRQQLDTALKYRAVILAMADWIEAGRQGADAINEVVEFYKRKMRQTFR